MAGVADIERLAAAAEKLEGQVRELRAEVERLADAERDRARAEAERVAVERERATESHARSAEAPQPGATPDEAEARLVAYSMVLDGKPRDEVARRLADELGFADSDALLDDLYARAAP